MARISAGTAVWAKWAVVPVALVVGGVAVSQASYSAFSATTENSANNWTAGSVKLDSDASTATFTAGNLKPGDNGAKCITVSSTGSLASSVKLYATKATTENALSSWIDVTITEGSGMGGDCGTFLPLSRKTDLYTGTLEAFAGKTDFKNGLATTWAPADATPKAPVTRTFKIAYTLNSEAPNTTQGGTASVGFTWEAQNS
jgi:hypothetical protein